MQVPKAVQEFFEEHPRVALAYSGGCDSAYLLACAVACGAEVKPYLVHSVFQYDFEPDDAQLFAQHVGVEFERLNVDVLAHAEVAENPSDRCYWCKRVIFSTILEHAAKEGITVLVDGTNATDDPERRPGFRALAELGVLSPLRIAGMTKEAIRAESARAGLPSAEKPSFSCKAVALPERVPITEEALAGVVPPVWR